MEDEEVMHDGHDLQVPEHFYYQIVSEPWAGHNLILSIVPSEQVGHQIVQFSHQIPQAFHLNRVHYNNIHITVTTLGRCLPETVRDLDRELRAMPKPPSFYARGRGLQAFPLAQRPNYLVTEVRGLDAAGNPVQDPADCPFNTLFRSIKTVLTRLDLEIIEHVPHNPHITIARNRFNDVVNPGNQQWLAQHAEFQTDQFLVDHFVLCGNRNTYLQTYPLFYMD